MVVIREVAQRDNRRQTLLFIGRNSFDVMCFIFFYFKYVHGILNDQRRSVGNFDDANYEFQIKFNTIRDPNIDRYQTTFSRVPVPENYTQIFTSDDLFDPNHKKLSC